MKAVRTVVCITSLCLAFGLSSCGAINLGALVSVNSPVGATGNPVGSKVGQASGNTFLEVLSFGTDVSIRRAAKNGGITRIATVDFLHSDYLGLVQAYTCTVTGE